MSSVVEVRGITHRYDSEERSRRPSPPALDEVDLEIEAGALCALIGANGSGKTTLLRILAGILQPSSGSVRLLGVEFPADRQDRQLRRRSSYLSQDPALDPEMTVGETLTLLAAMHGVGRAERQRRVEEVAAEVELGDRLERRADALSGGQRRRLHLAAGMIHNPEWLCLDEPEAGLDPAGGAALWASLRRRAEAGLTTAIVSHDLVAVSAHATTVVVLERGKIVAAGPPGRLQRIEQKLATPLASNLAEAFEQLTGRAASALEPGSKRRSRHRRRGRR